MHKKATTFFQFARSTWREGLAGAGCPELAHIFLCLLLTQISKFMKPTWWGEIGCAFWDNSACVLLKHPHAVRAGCSQAGSFPSRFLIHPWTLHLNTSDYFRLPPLCPLPSACCSVSLSRSARTWCSKCLCGYTIPPFSPSVQISQNGLLLGKLQNSCSWFQPSIQGQRSSR